MKADTAQEIVSHNNRLRVHEDYSGRGMFGKVTTGIVGDHTDLYVAIESFLIANELDIDAEEYIDSFRSDSMGLEFIWY